MYFDRYSVNDIDKTELANFIAAIERDIEMSRLTSGEKYKQCCMYYAYAKCEQAKAEKYALSYKQTLYELTLEYVAACNLLGYIHSLEDTYTHKQFAKITSSFQEALDTSSKILELNPAGSISWNLKINTEQGYALRNLGLAYIRQFLYDPNPLLAIAARCKGEMYYSQAIEKFKIAIDWQKFYSQGPLWPLGAELKQAEKDLQDISTLKRTAVPSPGWLNRIFCCKGKTTYLNITDEQSGQPLMKKNA